jgi:hypothetical protein
MNEAGSTHPRAQRTPDRVAERRGNVFAFLSLVSGVCSWVPLVVLVTGPLTLVFGLLAFWTARRRGTRQGTAAAVWGLVLAGIAVVLQGLVLASAGVVGVVGGWLGIGG